MKILTFFRVHFFMAFIFISTALLITVPGATDAQPKVGKPKVSTAVTVTDSGGNWILDNGIVRATINKANGRMSALVFQGINTMHGGGSWEQTPRGDNDAITIDPAKNGGERAEVSIKGAPTGGIDVELRYAMSRGASGIYAYAIYTHPAANRAAGYGENRYITRLNQNFDWISVDADRNMLECTPKDWGTGVVINAKEQRILSTGYYKNSVEHKYSYNAVQYKIPAYGWSSTRDHIGVYFINPSTEYLSGGSEKVELVCHFDSNDDPDPIILDYWTGGHYGGGAGCNVPAGEEWSKVVGPIFVYCNALADPKTPSPSDLNTLNATAGNPTVPPAWRNNSTALFKDALAQAKVEKAGWPYDWVNGVDYPHKDQRGTVTGQLVLSDPQAATTNNSLNNYQAARSKVPENINPEDAHHYTGLIEKQDALNNQISTLTASKEGKHPALVKDVDEKISSLKEQSKAIDNQLEKMANSDEPSVHEVDEMTGERNIDLKNLNELQQQQLREQQAQDLGFDHPAHLINATNKELGTDYKTMEEIPPEDLNKVVDTREDRNNKVGNSPIQDVYLNIRQNGLTKENLQQIKDHAKDIEEGKSKFTRFTDAEQNGLAAGGRTNVEASLVAAGSLRAGEAYKGRQLEQWEENERQEADITQYAKQKNIWSNNTDEHLTERYGKPIESGKEARVWYDEKRKVVIKSFNTFEYPDLQKTLDGITLHNSHFPETSLKVVGFGKDAEGDFNVIVEQPFIEHNSVGEKPTEQQLQQLAKERGFDPHERGIDNSYKSEQTNLHDLHDENVIPCCPISQSA